MLAVLILAALTAIAFSLATIVFIEIRSSGDVLRTEPAVYATLGVTEEALFQFKRYVPSGELDIVNCGGKPKNVCSLNGVTMSLPETPYGPQPIQFNPTVPLAKIIPGGTREEIPLYLNDFTRLYNRVEVKVFPSATSSPRMSVRRTLATGAQTLLPAIPGPTPPGATYSSAVFDNNAQYDLIIDNTATGNGDVSVAIYTYDTNGTSLKGIPYLGQNVLSVVANYLGLSRTYRVQIPLSGGGAGGQVNVAAASAGATATASSSYVGYRPEEAINSDRLGELWTSGSGGWHEAYPEGIGIYPDYLEVNFAGPKTISKVNVFSVQDEYWAPVDPTPSLTFKNYGVTSFEIEQWDGSSWVPIPGTSVTKNEFVWAEVSFGSVTTTAIRLRIDGAQDEVSRVIELEAWGF